MGSAFGQGLKPHSFWHDYAALKRRSSTRCERPRMRPAFFEEQIPRGWSQIGKTHDRGLLAYFRFWSKKSRIIV